VVTGTSSDQYLATLFAPDGPRARLQALDAFTAEITRIPSLVSEPQLGLIRLQWWSETLASGAGDHPVAAALIAAKFPVAPLQQLITAHEFDLYDDVMPDLASLELYLGETSSVLIQLAAMALDAQAAPKAAEAAGLAGVAYGLARVLGRGESKFIPPGETAASLTTHVRQRLAEARAAAKDLPTSLLPAFLPLALTGLYLKGQPSQFRRQLNLWWAARRERF
jgi:15-cis-phytoene synthase